MNDTAKAKLVLRHRSDWISEYMIGCQPGQCRSMYTYTHWSHQENPLQPEGALADELQLRVRQQATVVHVNSKQGQTLHRSEAIDK